MSTSPGYRRLAFASLTAVSLFVAACGQGAASPSATASAAPSAAASESAPASESPSAAAAVPAPFDAGAGQDRPRPPARLGRLLRAVARRRRGAGREARRSSC